MVLRWGKKKKKKFFLHFSVVSCEPVRNRAAIFDWLATVGSPRLSSLSPCYSRTSICVFWHQLHNNTLPSLVLSFSRSRLLFLYVETELQSCSTIMWSFVRYCFTRFSAGAFKTGKSDAEFRHQLPDWTVSRWTIDIDFCTWPSNGRVPPENLCLFNGRVESSGISSLR